MKLSLVLGTALGFVAWLSLVHATPGLVSRWCPGWSNTRVSVDQVQNYTIQSEGVGYIRAIVFLTKSRKRICSNPDSQWAKRAMRKVDEETRRLQETPPGPQTKASSVAPALAEVPQTTASSFAPALADVPMTTASSVAPALADVPQSKASSVAPALPDVPQTATSSVALALADAPKSMRDGKTGRNRRRGQKNNLRQMRRRRRRRPRNSLEESEYYFD